MKTTLLIFLTMCLSWKQGNAHAQRAPKQLENGQKAEPNEIQRWAKFSESMKAMTKANWREYLEGCTRQTIQTGATFNEQWELALTRIGEVAGKEALEAWKAEEAATGKFTKCWRGMVGWAAQDPAGARAWWEALAAGEMKNQLAGALVWGLSQKSADEVTKFFLNAPDWVQQRVGGDAVRALTIAGDFNASAKFVAAWSDKLGKDADGPRKLFGEVIRIRQGAANLESKPEATCQWLLAHGGQKYLNLEGVKSAALAWAAKDPAKAFQWAASFNTQETTRVKQTPQAVAELWAKKNLDEISDWTVNHPESPGLEAAICGIAKALAPTNLDGALGWLEVLTDPTLKLQMTAQVKGAAKTSQSPPGKK